MKIVRAHLTHFGPLQQYKTIYRGPWCYFIGRSPKLCWSFSQMYNIRIKVDRFDARTQNVNCRARARFRHIFDDTELASWSGALIFYTKLAQVALINFTIHVYLKVDCLDAIINKFSNAWAQRRSREHTLFKMNTSIYANFENTLKKFRRNILLCMQLKWKRRHSI